MMTALTIYKCVSNLANKNRKRAGYSFLNVII